MARQGWGQLSPIVTFAAEERREGRFSPQPLWGGLLTPSTSRVPTGLCPAPRAGSEHGAPRAFHCRCLICCSSRSRGAEVLQATFGKGCGRVTAVLAWNGDQVKVVTLLHEYLSPKQRPWSFLLPRFSVQVTPAQLTITWEREELIQKQISQLDCSSVRERFGYEVLSAKALPLHFLNQLLILP